MRTQLGVLVVALLIVGFSAGAQERSSGPLAFVQSDVRPKTIFWIQGRFVPVDSPNYQGNAEVATVVCLMREYECLELDGETELAATEQVWVQEFKPVSWDSHGILATSRSLDGCTDEALKIRFTPASVVLINSPVLPMPKRCKGLNEAMDKLVGKEGQTIKAQLEQDVLVPTRGLLPFQDVNPNSATAAPADKKGR